MRIKKLELIGFKSFKDRTVIQFDAGITGIVGPNGCGKSNIVDALMWSMGEMSAKHLRGSSMEDVIFAGAEGYAPMGMCEVSLTLENDGGPFPVQYLKHSEIMVTRRLHRGGESEYFINKEPARLRDIQEIFMDTGAGAKGFSIIQQNAIGQLVTSKPEDRRHLIEEAAGITKFKARKRESQRKLVSTEQNLVRLHDIVNELKRQIDSLERQAQRAERYRNLKREAEDLDLWLSSRQFIELREKSQTALVELAEAQAADAQAMANTDQQEMQSQALQMQVSEAQMRVEDLQSEAQELQLQVGTAEREIQELRFEIESARRSQEMTGGMLESNGARRLALAAEVERLQRELSSVAERAANFERDYQEKKERWENTANRIEEVDQELTDSRREFLTVSQAEASIQGRVTGLEDGVRALEERAGDARAVLEELLTKKLEFETRRKKVWNELEKNRQESLDLARDVDSFKENRATLERQIVDRRAEVDVFRDELAEITGKLYGLENLASNFEGFEAGVKSVMFWQRQKLEALPESDREQVAFHPVAEVVEVPAEFELAMEAALGPRLQMLLSPNADTALEAVNFLKDQKSGRSSFVAGGLQTVETTIVEPPRERLRAILSDVVQAPASFQSTISRLLKNVAVVDSIGDALELRRDFPMWTFVTVDGDTVTHEGVITGGTAESADSGILARRREIKELSLRKDEAAGKLGLAQASLKKMEENLHNIDHELESVETRAQEKEILLASLKKDLERAEQELANAEQAISRQERDVHSLDSQVESRRAELEELQMRLTSTLERKVELDARIAQLTQDLEVVRGGAGGLQEEVARLQAEASQSASTRDNLQKQLDFISAQLSEVDATLAKMSEESQKSNQTISTSSVVLEEKKLQLEEMIRRLEDARVEVSTARDAYERVSAEALELQRVLAGAMTAKAQLQAKMNEATLVAEQCRMKEQYLVDQIRERYMVELGEVAERYRDREGDTLEAEAKLKDLREKIGKIGEVNLSAIEEFDKVRERYEFLSKQQQDLVDAKEQLKKVIDRINRVCAKRFKDTFDQVNERFTKVFPVLFGGGEAQLILVEDPEKGEMGIDIIAKPPGKKLQNMSLLSGGEKALTAVSLIFSIFLVRPSPYCLLDEVDAPLDDANVFRFNDLVKEMAKRSQIIVVTHNKFTMEVASRLYGVTMEERGVSKMVSVNLDTVPN
ncbi:MAG TPA: chromosome segregation protein SMC [Pseudobdellovibrionaceae bacterium]|nr:chromosome segregation protein SMC [Pseudobdellovibrionaceae bacterium]